MSLAKFADPITFLGLEGLPAWRQKALRPRLYLDMSNFLLQQFTASLSGKQLEVVRKNSDKIKTYEQVLKTIAYYDPDFHSKKPALLQIYRKEFKRNRALKLTQKDEKFRNISIV